MSEINNEVKTVGHISYFDPNQSFGQDNQPVNLEDLNFYVNLYVKVPSRYGNSQVDIDSVLGGTKFNFNEGDDGKYKTIPLLTNDYVNVSFTELKDGKITKGELFGIDNINIQFDVQFFPRVTINFTDIRGYGLMNPMELISDTNTSSINKRDLSAKSFFTSLFNFPYPIFTLEVKGYYGKSITYDLSLEDFNTEFDSNTGDFKTRVSFIGALNGIFGDLPMGFLLIAPYLFSDDVNENVYWKNIDDSDDLPTYLKFMDLYYKIISKNGDDGNEENIRELKDFTKKTEYLNALNAIKNKYEDLIFAIKESWKKTKDKNITIEKLGLYFLSGNPGVNSENNKIESVNDVDSPFGWKIKIDEDVSKFLMDNGLFDYDSYIKFKYSNKDNMLALLYSEGEDCKTAEVAIYKINLINSLAVGKDLEKWKVKYEKKDLDYIFGFYISSILKKYSDEVSKINIFNEKYFETLSFKLPDINFCFYDFIELNKKYEGLIEAIKTVEKDINEEKLYNSLGEYVKKILDFDPTIDTLYNVLFKHLHCFSEVFLNIIKNVENDKRTCETILGDYISDVPESKKNSPLPPFPMVAQKTSDNSIKIIYPNNVQNFTNRPEIILTEEIYNKSRFYKSNLNATRTKIERLTERNKFTTQTNVYNFINDIRLRTEDSMDGFRNYEVLFNYIDYTPLQKAELIRDIFLSRAVTYISMYGDNEIITFIAKEAKLLHAANLLFFQNEYEVLKILDTYNNEYLLNRFNQFKTLLDEKDLGFINYYPNAEEDISSLDYKVLHKNNDKDSTCWVLFEGDDVNDVANFLKTGNFDYHEIKLPKQIHSLPEKDDYDYSVPVYDGYGIKKEAINSKVYFNKSSLLKVDGSWRHTNKDDYIYENDYAYLFNKYNVWWVRTGTMASSMHSDPDTYKSIELDRKKINSIIVLHKSQILLIGEWYSFFKKGDFYTYGYSYGIVNSPNTGYQKYEEKQKRSKWDLALIASHSYDYEKLAYFITISEFSNTNFFDFCLSIYNKFLESGPEDDALKEYYVIGKSFKFNVSNLLPINSFWKTFVKEIKKNNNIPVDITLSDEKKEEERVEQERIEIKTNIYYTLKNIFDKWYASLSENVFKYNVLKNSVKYYNTLSKDISKELYFDIGKFTNQISSFIDGSNEISDAIGFMSKTAQDNNCNFIILPNQNNTTLSETFKPHSFYKGDITHNPYSTTFILMHNGDVSHHLAIENGEYENDGFDIANYNGEIEDGFVKEIAENSHMLAFGVTYGMQNQNIFKSISVNTNNPTTTDYSIANTLIIAGSGSNVNITNNTINTQFLYPVYANRSYECNVQMMGCMNIRPLMYFQLNNVPMFRGVYIITNVSHIITPNDFTTTFTGTRVSKYNVPIYDKNLSLTTFFSLFDKREDYSKNSIPETTTKSSIEEEAYAERGELRQTLPPVNTDNDIINLDKDGLYWKGYDNRAPKGHKGLGDCWKSGLYAMEAYYHDTTRVRNEKNEPFEVSYNNGNPIGLGSRDKIIRLTWQASGSNKLQYFNDCASNFKEKYDLAIDTIKFHLCCNAPIMVGVNHSVTTHNPDGTDHFIVIYAWFKHEGKDCFRYYETGRNQTRDAFTGNNDTGGVNYLIYEPGDEPKFYNPNSCRLKAPRKYDVTQIRPYIFKYLNAAPKKEQPNINKVGNIINNYENNVERYIRNGYN